MGMEGVGGVGGPEKWALSREICQFVPSDLIFSGWQVCSSVKWTLPMLQYTELPSTPSPPQSSLPPLK